MSNESTNGPSDHQYSLPSSDSPSLKLVAPTYDQKVLQFTHNGASWRGALEIPKYIERELHMANQDLTKDNGLTYWILVDSSLPVDQQVALSGCETLKKRAVLARPDGWVMEVQCHGVGSVFCPDEYRGRGYAGRMMKDLGEKLKTWQGFAWGDEDKQSSDSPDNTQSEANGTNCSAIYDPNYPKSNLFSVLWSDIGKSFYAKHGWAPFSSAQIALPTTILSSVSQNTLESLPPSYPIYTDDIPALCETDEHLICQSMVRACRISDPKKTYVAILPDAKTITWHHAREESVAKQIYDSSRGVPSIKGAIVGNLPGERVWCYFGHVWESAPSPQVTKGNKLYIMRLVVEEMGMLDWETADESTQTSETMKKYVPAIAALLVAAIKEAGEWDLHSVEVWNPTKAVVDAARIVAGDSEKVEIVQREDSIPSLMWYGKDVGGGLKGMAGGHEEVVWLGNDKYGIASFL